MLKIYIWLVLVSFYDTNTSIQATFYDSHKITALILPVYFSKGLSTLEIYSPLNQQKSVMVKYVFFFKYAEMF